MNNRCCCCCISCTAVGIFLSIIFAILIGVLFFFGLVPGITTAIWIALGVAAFAAIVTFVNVLQDRNYDHRSCICEFLRGLIVGIVGTIITAIIALAIPLIPFIVLIAILVGLVAFFLALVISQLVCFLLCKCGND
ncbi:MAG: hypothetical protein Q8882_09315 [Bacillota bacterium]|nr:hypothetical protein [Bacillota bacterium]